MPLPTKLPGPDGQKMLNCTSKKCQIASKIANQAETGQWLSALNYMDVTTKVKCYCRTKPRFITNKVISVK